ncbi:MAG: threonine--tRNA ligase [Candidatus Eisenbacteria bacterium]|uniref:Threonine--tRNA ligase n=1 Tax=Eiseniibacteriota bacterium TaxID=2212470 RepID=A0A849SMI1_UNCEI|nr:threonine--tRNA ligase [Candidatus Eisenbacteria bacterium]
MSVATEDRPDVSHYPGGEALYRLRHSAAHVLATAVTELFPDVKVAGGPPVENGFYYDFARDTPFSTDDLERIEARMREIVAADQPFEFAETTREAARAHWDKAGEKYKLHFLSVIPEDAKVTTYTNGKFVDLCRGPHVASTGRIGAFKLTHVAGAYWLGSERNEMLQRIYGTAFASPQELEEHLKRVEEALKRDHRRLGRELELFSLHEEVGPGLVFWHPKLGMVRHLMETLWRDEHQRRGYHFVYTPHISSEKLFEVSGHLQNYADLMYSPMDIDGQPFRMKPMNCPGHIMIYKTTKHSYRELPIRYAELGTVYRYERSGVLHGMERVRGFTQDDSHIFCTPDQLASEVEGVLDLMDFLLRTYKYEHVCYLATRPKEKSLGTDEEWTFATEALRAALERRGLPYEVDEGGGAFYAPKIDVKLRDALGREWQCPTIQVDLNLPKRFGVTYTGSDGQEHECIMLHRALYGSLERFAGIFIEHTGGDFPVWIAPTQVMVIPTNPKAFDYATETTRLLKEQGVRAQCDLRDEKLNAKIRDAEVEEKIPYMLVVGPREAEAGTVTPRRKGVGQQETVTREAFLERVLAETRARS